MRTDQQIVDETNTLALWLLNEVYGYEVPEGHKFYEANDSRSKMAWQKACRIQEIMTKTDPNDALSSIHTEAEDEPIIRSYPVRLWITARMVCETSLDATSMEDAIAKAKELDFSDYDFVYEEQEGDESAHIDDPENVEVDPVEVDLRDEGEPFSWDACRLVQDLAEIDMETTDAFHASGGYELVNELVSRAKRACTKITGGMEG